MLLNRIVRAIKQDGIKKVVQRKVEYIYHRIFYKIAN
jgi:hypothetical protein